jgi:hypothetical protein
MYPMATTSSRGRAALIAALVAVLSAVLAFQATQPEPAGAVSKVPKGAVKKLRKQPCPPTYAVRVARPAETAEIAAAKQGRFNLEGTEVKLGKNTNWQFNPNGSLAFQARLHDLRFLDILFYAYRENGDRKALRKAKQIIVDWVKNNPLKRPTTARTWFDKVAGDRAAYIAYGTRAAACEGLLKNPKLARKLLGSVEQHIRFLGKRKLYSDTNRGLFMDLGLIFSGRQMRFLPGATKARNRGERRFVGNVQDHVIPGEAMWLEHSSTYQFLTINAIERYLEVIEDKKPFLNEILPQMKDTAAWMTMPDQLTLQNGDAYQDKASRFAQAINRTQQGIRVLGGSGVAFVKPTKKKNYLSFLANYHSEIHRHSDDLSFDLYENGHRVVSDSGIPDKDFGTPYLYAISSPAHSVVTVDGQDFPRDREQAYGSGLLASGEGAGWYALLGTNPTVASQGVDHQRLLLYKPGSALIVADRLRSPSEHTYTSYFQFGPEFGLQPTAEGVRLFDGADEVQVSNLSTVPLQRQAVRGQDDPLLGYVWEDFRDRDPRWVQTTTARGSDVDNVSTISVDPEVAFRASAAAPLGDVSTFVLDRDGVAKKAITVTRSGGALSVQETPIPYG